MSDDQQPRTNGKSSPGGPWRSYKERLARLAQRLVDAQRPIRILNAIKWDPSVFERFRDSKWRDLPPVGADFYETIGLGFDPLVHALNALPVAGEYAINSSGAHVRYELIFSYLQGPPVTVQVGSADPVAPGAVDNGTIQATSAGNVLNLVRRLFS